MAFSFFDLLTLLGALGFFIFGMKVMSEGIQKIAGNSLRSVLASITNNRFSGVATGFGITSLIQSSSATTVMIVSFVNAGLLSLRQSIGVIMGANIGTTMTAWLISLLGFSKFSITSYSLPIIAIAFPLLFSRKQKHKYFAEFLIGFSLLFMGLGALKDSVPELNAVQLGELKHLADLGFLSTLLFVGIGTLLTIIIQSSSAAMALTLAMCANGLPIELGAAIVLGENIGTTITANLAALIGNTTAKRSARAHFIFNIFGVLWMLLIFKYFTHGVANIAESFGWWGNPFSNPKDQIAVTRTLALFHTSFNVINTLALIWFVPLIEKIVTRMVPDKKTKERTTLKFLSYQLLDTPELALSTARNEMFTYISAVEKMLHRWEELINSKDSNQSQKALSKIEKLEEEVNKYHKEISKFMVKLNQKPLSKEISKKCQVYIDISRNLESIGDLINTISESYFRKLEEVNEIPNGFNAAILKFIKGTKSQIEIVKGYFGTTPPKDFEKVIEAFKIFQDSEIFTLSSENYAEFEEGNIPIDEGLEYSKLLVWEEQISFKMGNILRQINRDQGNSILP